MAFYDNDHLYEQIRILREQNERMKAALEAIRAESYPGFWVTELIDKALGEPEKPEGQSS